LQVATTRIEVVAERRFGWIDLTDDLRRAVKDSGVVDGCAIAFCAHTTSSILINEWEDGALEDLEHRLGELIPVAAYYAHDDLDRRTQNLVAEERKNGPAHVAQMILGGTSQYVPIESGELLLGTWQRVLLLELDEPKRRTCVFQIWGA
jgi:secondary thiamine-phosphate synthase enzyme